MSFIPKKHPMIEHPSDDSKTTNQPREIYVLSTRLDNHLLG